ncbi:F-box protein At2g17036-like [Carex rostrata]
MNIYWSILPEDCIEQFSEKLDSHKDFLSSGAVCTSWRSVFKNNIHRLPFKIAISHCLPKGKPLPVLLLYNSVMDGKRYRLFNLSNEKMAEVSHEFELSKTVNKWIMGSWRGWLLVANYFSGKRMALINPLTGEEVRLPSFSSLAMHLVNMNNVACSSSCPPAPNNKDNNCMVMFACNYSSICCCKIGDDKWNTYEHPHGIVNLVNHNGIFYAIDTKSDLYKITMMEHTIDVQLVLAWGTLFDHNQGHLSKNCVVESSGELLLVTRAMVNELLDGIPHTQIFKLTSKYVNLFGVKYLTNYKWQKIEDIGNRIIFVGHKDSISVESSLYPGTKGNCIYFTHVIDHNLHTVVFNLTNQSVEYILLDHVDSNLEALWFSPNPW